MITDCSFSTNKQHQEIQISILQYLKTNGLSKSFQALSEEIGLDPERIEDGMVLEKKWTSVMRLQRKLCELEEKSKLDNCGRNSKENSYDLANTNRGRIFKFDLLKASKNIMDLQGHQKCVNCIDFHPTQNILASGSDDATIKIWDLESGSFLRTLKGHTLSVTCVKFTDDFLSKDMESNSHSS